jgi:nucleotide-binding universal stress UspA family protein
MRYKTILCGITGSGASFRAALGAALLAKENNARLIHVYAVDTAFVEHVTVELPPELAGESLERLGKRILDQAQTIAGGQGIVAERKIRKGSLLKVLGEVAREEAADLLVLGREERSFFDRVFFGKGMKADPDALRKRVGVEAVII